MAVGSAAALICDTGALIDYLVESAPDHRLFRSAIDQARTRYVPGLVLAVGRDVAIKVLTDLCNSCGRWRCFSSCVSHPLG